MIYYTTDLTGIQNGDYAVTAQGLTQFRNGHLFKVDDAQGEVDRLYGLAIDGLARGPLSAIYAMHQDAALRAVEDTIDDFLMGTGRS